jgi:ribose-phosphate pyrophosphokinase
MSVQCPYFCSLQFPDGSRHWRIQDKTAVPVFGENVTVTMDFRGSDDILDIVLLADSIRSLGAIPHLNVRYFPMGRQDRRMLVGETHGVKAMSTIIAAAKYMTVTVWDPHSDVIEACLEQAGIKPIIIDQAGLFGKMMMDMAGVNPPENYPYGTPFGENNFFTVVAPDSGAVKKAANCMLPAAMMYQSKGVKVELAVGHKKRDPETGKLTIYPVNDPEHALPRSFCAMVVDDICDGGGTFIPMAADILRLSGNPKGFKLGLYVTHALLTKGVQPLRDAGFNFIITPNLMNDSAEVQAEVGKFINPAS